jgi:spore maturation protein CgeB
MNSFKINKRILVAASTFPWDIGERCVDAFRDLGYDAELWKYDMMCTKPTLRNRIAAFLKPRLMYSREIVQLFDAYLYNQQLLKKVRRKKPSLLFIIDGKIFSKNTLQKIRKTGVCAANWFTDDPFDFKTSSRICNYYNYFFTHDSYIIPKYTEKGQRNISFLPFACDPRIHCRQALTKFEQKEFSCDVSFVGSIGKQRIELIEKLIDLPIKFKMWGEISNIDNRLLIKNHYMGRASGSKMIKIYNSSRIALNVHVGFGEEIERYGYGTNMRLFELAGCGTFQLVDYKKDIEKLFKIGYEIVCYKSIRDLKDKIQYYLNNPKERERIAQRMQKRAYQEHTYMHRMQEVLKVTGIL